MNCIACKHHAYSPARGTLNLYTGNQVTGVAKAFAYTRYCTLTVDGIRRITSSVSWNGTPPIWCPLDDISAKAGDAS